MPDGSLKTLFEARVAAHPERVAATCGPHRLTFRELDARAEQVARRLRRGGVTRDALVGICLPRSLDMLAGVLAVVKAGAAYLPLDPAYPRERLEYMLQDSRVGSVLGAGAPGLCLPTGVEWLDLAAEAPEPGEGPDASAPDDASNLDDALAYVIYTSGSTGEPKGVLGTERGMLNRLRWMWQAFPFRPDDVGCVKTSLSFLDSFWEIFGPLLQGVPVVVVPDEVVKDAPAFVHALEAGRVTRLVVVPSLLRALLAAVPDIGPRLARLDLWVTSGEALLPELARRFRETFPSARLLNLYGASEVSADCAWYDVSAGSPESVAIGRPLPENQVHLLDEALRPVPDGAPGDLYVSGVSLARGYLRRPGLTAERFLPNPFGPAGARMYRSGDVGRRRADGVLELLGRSDQQVKVRGFRVELGEVEAALARHPAVAQVAVAARRDAAGQAQLVGYVVPVPGAVADGVALRAHLAQALPDYMVPSAIVPLAALPLTPSGKLDRNALPAPEYASRRKAPRSPREEVLAGLFAEVLELEQVGVDDRFFDLGGDSISSMELVSRARAAGFAITSGDVFRHQSVEALAAALAAAP